MHAARIAGLVAVALLVLPAASAQVETTATITLTVPASAGSNIPLGGNTSADVGVAITINNIVCQGNGSATVHLAAADVGAAVPGITATIPSTVTFVITGPMAYSVNGPYNGAQQSVKLNVTVDSTAPANHDHQFNVTATMAQADISCSVSPAPGSNLPVTATSPFAIMTGPPLTPPVTNGTTGPDGSVTPTDTEAAVSLPFGLQLVTLLGVGVLIALRRRQ